MNITSLDNLCYLHKLAKFTKHSLDAESKLQIIIHRYLDVLLRPQIPLSGLDGRMPKQEFDLFQIPAVLRHSLAQVRRRSWAPKCSMPICLDDCSTIDQTAQSLSVARLILPLFEIKRSSRPSSIPAAIIQALMPCLTQIGMATVRMRRPLPSRSARTQRPSLCWMVSTSSSATVDSGTGTHQRWRQVEGYRLRLHFAARQQHRTALLNELNNATEPSPYLHA